jgi:hypothetical protein
MSVFDVDSLVSQAVEAAGSDDFGDPTWREGLERLLPDFDGPAMLHDIGVEVVRADLSTYLVNRLQVTAWRTAHPEVADVRIERPIIIVGQPRTGTTILYDLLAQDPRWRVPRSWEVDKPVPPAEPESYLTDPRIEQAQAQYDLVDSLIPGFSAFHEVGAMLGQECVRITAGDFRSMIFPTQYRVPAYARWLLDEADMAPAYDWHRLFLQHLQSEYPTERWVVKSPGHIWSLDALMTAYPDAILVQTHRDPLRIIASVSSLIATLRSLSSDEVSIVDAAAEFSEYILDGVDRSVAARKNGIVPVDRVVDVQFREFMADPFATIGAIYDRLGLELTDEAETRMRTFLATNPQDKHGTHQYTFADTELREDEIRERAASYMAYFDVPSEPL